jgi:hypothetical protein
MVSSVQSETAAAVSMAVVPAAAGKGAWQRWRADVPEAALPRTAQPVSWSPFTGCPAV